MLNNGTIFSLTVRFKMAGSSREIFIAATLTIENIKNIVDSSSTSDSDSDDYECLNLFIHNSFRGQQNPRPRIQNYMDCVISRMSNSDFKTHFRYV